MNIKQELEIIHSLAKRKEKIAYIGWVGHDNLGDEILLEAHKKLFSEYEIIPVMNSKMISLIEKMHIFPYKAVFLGGGTLIYKPSQSRTILENYKSRGIRTFCM